MPNRSQLLLAVACAALLAHAGSARAALPEVRWRGYVQARETLRPRGGGLTATLNRARLTADARLDSSFSLSVSAEFASSAGVQLRDAYVAAERGEWVIQAGQFKTPMSREYLLSASALEVPDRATVVESLATRRDIGVQLGFAPDPRIELALGVFNGEGQNVAVNRDSTVIVVGRIAVEPAAGVGLGVSGVAFGDDSTRAGAELALAVGRAWLRGEVIAQWIDGRRRRDEGWYVLAGCRVRPSWALVARREDLVRPALSAARSRHRATTVGLLWEPPGGRVRGLLDWVERVAGQEETLSHAWIAQLQGKF